MVMETPPSPQCVGREFVRQYYTLLNEAPAHLHRFYNNSSSFIHGGLDAPNQDTTPVVGQRQIHQRIQQLNFRDCHAKISQVDSQATLGNGVVVQVTGELSNGGQPMRRFTQTFVLAAQSPKKFYVHNDIFRYQDMLTDEELEAEMGRSEAEEDHETEQIPVKNDIHKPEGQPNVGYYGGVNQVVNGTSESVVREEPVPAAPAPVHEPHSQPPISINTINEINQQPLIMQQVPEQPPTSNQAPLYPPPEEAPVQSPEPVEQTQFHQQQIVDGPMKTYANLVKSGGGQVGSGTVFYNNNAPPQNQSLPKPSSPPPARMEARSNDNKLGQSGPKPPRGNDLPPRNNFPPPRPQNSTNDDNGNYGGGPEGERRRQYPDSHQLFMGNIPHNATEADLREIFGKFGTIYDLRVLSKGAGKGQVPNYGFITFEETSAVQAVLNAKPIVFPGDGEKEVKLNVEEKKARRVGGPGEGGRGGGVRGGSMRGGGMGGPPRGGRGGGGAMRYNPNTRR